MARQGTFITFEGGEGSGKSTHIERLVTRLRAAGRTVLVTREPGGTEVGEQIRHVLLHGSQAKTITSETELLLFCASRAQLVREIIAHELKRGKVVICDRYYDSTTVYQGVGRDLDLELVAKINRFAIGKCIPKLTIVIDVDPRIGLARTRDRGGPRVIRGDLFDHMETRSMDFFDRVRQGFLDLAKQAPDRVKVVDGSRSIEEVQIEIWEHVRHVL